MLFRVSAVNQFPIIIVEPRNEHMPGYRLDSGPPPRIDQMTVGFKFIG